MSKEIQLSNTDLETLARAGVIPMGTPLPIVTVFAESCKQYGLSPFKKEIYLVKYGEKYANIVSIDGFRTKAARTGQFAGCDDVKFNLSSDGKYQTASELKASGKYPTTATVTVYRMVSGVKCAFTHTAVFAEFYAGAENGKGYSKAVTMPFQMISKVAEAFALKKGFSDELGGLNIEEEASAFTGDTVSAVTIHDVNPDEFKAKIKSCQSIEELMVLYKNTPYASDFAEEFTDRKFDLNPELMHKK